MSPEAIENLFKILQYVINEEFLEEHYESELAYRGGDEQHPAVVNHIYNRALRALSDLRHAE